MSDQSLFQQAKKRIMEMMNMGADVSQEDRESVQHALRAAYEQATTEERGELEQLEQQLKDNQLL